MTKQVQRRRGTATQHTSFTGAEGELSVNTTNKSVHVHDNVTAGGFEAARVDMDNVTSSSILTAAGITASTTELNYVDGVTSAIQTQIDGKAGTASPTFTGTLTTANLTATGTTTLAGASTSADITFGDNDKAIFGAGSDLSIFHNGSSSLIEDSGTGGLTIRSNLLTVQNAAGNETVAQFVQDGFVKLFHNNSQVFTTTSTGIDVTGTVTADGLTVDGNIIQSGGDEIQNSGTLRLNGDYDASGAGNLELKTKGILRQLVLNSGDISFYEDTGTTAKFFWDASAESLGIGTSSPARLAEIYGTTNPALRLNNGTANVDIGIATAAGALLSGSSANDLVIARNGAYNIKLGTNGTTRMTLDSSGNVGISATPPTTSGYTNLTLGASTIGSYINLYGATSGFFHRIINNNGDLSIQADAGNVKASTNLIFSVDASEAMRISGGNVGIGTSSPSAKLDVRGAIRLGNTVPDVADGGRPIIYASDGTGSHTGHALVIQARDGAGSEIDFVTGTTPTTRMHIDSSGNVGIGTSSPFDALHVQGTIRGNVSDASDENIRLTTDGGGGFVVDVSDATVANPTWSIRTFSNEPLAFDIGGTERMRIDSSGNLLVGTTNSLPADNNVEGIALSPQYNGGIIQVSRTGQAGLTVNRRTSDGNIALFKKDGTTVGAIGVTNTIGIRNTYIAGTLTGLSFANASIFPTNQSGAVADNSKDLGYGSGRFNDAFITNGVTTGSDGNDKQDIRDLTEAEQRVAVACKGLLKAWRWKDAVATKDENPDRDDKARIHVGIIAQDLQAAFAAEGLDAGRYAMFMSNTWTDEETGEERTRMGVRYSELLAFIIAAI